MTGTLALIGGAEFTPASVVDQVLLEAAGGGPVLVLPTAAAYEHPDRAVATAEAWFTGLGAEAEACMVLGRPDAFDPANVERVRASRFTFLAGGSPMHLRSVLKDTPLWDAMVAAWLDGGVLAGSSAGAMVLTDPMVDPRGGAFTLGLGLVKNLAVVPHREQWSADRLRRTLDLAHGDLAVVTLDSGAAVVRGPDGRWTAHGEVSVYVGGHLRTVDHLADLSA